jgi:hypothetical protein
VFAALANSDRLARLHSRICRPLDKPMAAQPGADPLAFDDPLDDIADPAGD